MSRVLPYQCLSIAKVLLHASKCVVRETYYTTAARTKMCSATVHGLYLRSHMLRGRAGGGDLWLYYLYVSMPGSKQRVALDRRSLKAYLMGVVRRFDEVPASV